MEKSIGQCILSGVFAMLFMSQYAFSQGKEPVPLYPDTIFFKHDSLEMLVMSPAKFRSLVRKKTLEIRLNDRNLFTDSSAKTSFGVIAKETVFSEWLSEREKPKKKEMGSHYDTYRQGVAVKRNGVMYLVFYSENSTNNDSRRPMGWREVDLNGDGEKEILVKWSRSYFLENGLASGEYEYVFAGDIQNKSKLVDLELYAFNNIYRGNYNEPARGYPGRLRAKSDTVELLDFDCWQIEYLKLNRQESDFKDYVYNQLHVGMSTYLATTRDTAKLQKLFDEYFAGKNLQPTFTLDDLLHFRLGYPKDAFWIKYYATPRGLVRLRKN